MTKAFVTVPSCFHSLCWDKPACRLTFRDVGVATGGATLTRLLPGFQVAERTTKPTNRSAVILLFPLNSLNAKGHGVRRSYSAKKKKKKEKQFPLSRLCPFIAVILLSWSRPLFLRPLHQVIRIWEVWRWRHFPGATPPAGLLGSGWMEKGGKGGGGQQQAATSGSTGVKKRRLLSRSQHDTELLNNHTW